MAMGRTFTGRRTMRPGDTVAIDTPYLNGVGRVVAGPDSERGTVLRPKFEIEIETAWVADHADAYVDRVPAGTRIWLEDDARLISIVGVDDDNIAYY